MWDDLKTNKLQFDPLKKYTLCTRLFSVPPMEFLCTLYLLACQLRVTAGDSGFCCCVCVTSFQR